MRNREEIAGHLAVFPLFFFLSYDLPFLLRLRPPRIKTFSKLLGGWICK